MNFTEPAPASAAPPDLATVRRWLFKVASTAGPDVNVNDGIMAAALLHLLPTTPPAGKHVVDDVQPHPHESIPAVQLWGKYEVWWDQTAEDESSIRALAGAGTCWMTPAEARTYAAWLLSAAARAEAAQQPAEPRVYLGERPPRDDQGRTPRERVRAGLPAYELTDEQVADVAVASGWIEDTPEARAAYLAGEDPDDEGPAR